MVSKRSKKQVFFGIRDDKLARNLIKEDVLYVSRRDYDLFIGTHYYVFRIVVYPGLFPKTVKTVKNLAGRELSEHDDFGENVVQRWEEIIVMADITDEAEMTRWVYYSESHDEYFHIFKSKRGMFAVNRNFLDLIDIDRIKCHTAIFRDYPCLVISYAGEWRGLILPVRPGKWFERALETIAESEA